MREINQERRKTGNNSKLGARRPFLISHQSMLVQLFVAIATTLVNFAELCRQFVISCLIWLEGSGFCHLSVPMPGPDAIGVTQAWRPGKHRLAKLDTGCFAEQS